MNEREALPTERLAARRYLYKVFGTVFGTEPDRLARGLDTALVGEALEIACGHGAGPGFVEWLGRPLEGLGGLYNTLFVGPGVPVASPWEGVHRSHSERRMFGPTALEVRRCYRAHGFEPQGYPNVSDDALALELDYLYELGERAFRAHLAGDDPSGDLAASREFLDEHLLCWVGSFAGRVVGFREESLYGEAAQALEAFVRADREWLGSR